MSLPSDEVAEDYKNSLEDLTTNDRFQISNLTVIAKENTEHAMAISRVLENHIRTCPPSQKLPALYVVDSVAKNVGSPYTLFLGRNLYKTFMDAYTLVDQPTRRKLDEMLKTWKEPVPGSLDPRPVFPPEITRSIENALIKARTAALQQQQARSQQDVVIGRARGTATPPGWTRTPPPSQPTPQAAQRYPPYTQSQQAAPVKGPPAPMVARNTLTSQTDPRTYPTPQPQQDTVDLGALHRDIENLITGARLEFATTPFDTNVQQRLKALLDLQSILQRQELPQDQLKLVREQVSALSSQSRPASQPQTQPPPASLPQNPTGAPTSTTQNQQIPPMTSQPNLQALLNSNTLAELIKATANRQQPTPPPTIPSSFSNPQPMSTPTSTSTAPASSAGADLIASLRARGLLPPVTSTMPPAAPSFPNLPLIVPGQPRPPPPVAPVATPQAPLGEISINVHMSTASIKIPRPVLIHTLYDAKSNKCGTCGRRFYANEEGKEKKARHLDWHFKTNQRMAEAAKRGQSRSWYVDERDWIKSREYDDADIGAAGSTTGTASQDGTSQHSRQSKQWIRAPSDATLRNAPCPICQEKFESTWSEEVQDWIWKDAVKVGNRVYHASCYAEVTTSAPAQGSAVARTSTPDSVLGKRKAEETDSPGHKTRIKTEPVS